MTTLDIINVGQGDCFVLRPTNGCAYNESTFIIDVGDGINDFTSCLKKSDTHLQIILSHSDFDHIGGMKYLFINDWADKIETITVPYYHNEIILIAKSLLNIKGIDKLSCTNELVRYLRTLVAGQKTFKKLSELSNKPHFLFGHEGKNPYNGCGHFDFYNPPIRIEQLPDYLADDEVVHKTTELFSEEYAGQLRTYFEMSKYKGNNRYRYSNLPEINSSIIDTNREADAYEQVDDDMYRYKANFLLHFFERNHPIIEDFISSPSIRLLQILVTDLKLKSNEASLVFKYSNDSSFLFTGDVNIKMFNQILKKGYDISCDILKVPHHGSKRNINFKILKAIQPQSAILSHHNGKFGRSKDTHPNIEVIKLLEDASIEIITSNDIVKNGCIIKSRIEPSNPNMHILDVH